MLPCPPVILAIMSFPHKTNQTTPPIINNKMTTIIHLMILRFFDTGFFAFFGLGFVESETVAESEAFNSPLRSSKLKT